MLAYRPNVSSIEVMKQTKNKKAEAPTLNIDFSRYCHNCVALPNTLEYVDSELCVCSCHKDKEAKEG